MSLHLFEGFGVELEYMIVDRETLAVRPIADRLLAAVSASGEPDAEVELGPISWSNELAPHVIELKTTAPAPSLAGLAERFQEHVRRIDALLGPLGARLMPTAMHPLMDPDRETVLWPHGSRPGLRRLRPHLRLPGPRLVEPPEHAPQPALRRRRGVRPAPRGDPPGAADPAGAGRQLADRRGPPDGHARQPPRLLPEQLPARPRGHRPRDPRAGRLPGRLRPPDPRADVRRDRARTTPTASSATSGSTPGAPSPASIATPSRSACSTSRSARPPTWRSPPWSSPSSVRSPTGRRSRSELQRAVTVDALEPIFLDCLRDADRARSPTPTYLAALGLDPADAPLPAGMIWSRLLGSLLEGDPSLSGSIVAGPLTTILDRGPAGPANPRRPRTGARPLRDRGDLRRTLRLPDRGTLLHPSRSSLRTNRSPPRSDPHSVQPMDDLGMILLNQPHHFPAPLIRGIFGSGGLLCGGEAAMKYCQ